MPLKLTVGLAKKIGQPHYGSLGASCGVELELASDAIRGDPDAFHAGVRAAFAACRRAVEDELQRQQASPDGTPARDRAGDPRGSNGNGHGNGHGPAMPASSPRDIRPARPATPRQVRTIVAIARRRRTNLAELLSQEFGVASLEQLSLSQASRLINGLKTATASST